jgi:hypothetical protein
MRDDNKTMLPQDRELADPARRAAGRGLDWLNLFVANVQTGFGPFISVYLTTAGWTQTGIGLALSVGTVAAMASQMPAGALVDRIRRKSYVAVFSILAFTISALCFTIAPIPLFVYLAHKALHPEVTQNNDGSVNLTEAERFIPAERHKNFYADQAIPRRPNANRAPEDKPALQRQIGNLPPLGPNTGTRDGVVRERQQTLMAIEEGVGQIFKALEETGQLDNTVIVFTSDNGYFYGEHGLSVERRLAYEESIRLPLLVRYPRLIKANTVRDECALNIDLAPTVLTLAGAPVPNDMQGRSLVPLLRGGKNGWRDSFLIEYYSDHVFPRIVNMGYKAVRTQRWKYIHYLELDGMDELYDLKADPYEMKNLVNQPNAKEMLKEMKKGKEIAEDDLHKAQERVQKTTDEAIARLDTIVAEKESEIMEI